ncbi:MAG: hypothetical protein HQK53_07075 [Oligoflexia bacterium]|nr:hypothetical protein [Oligoflexia bacterium]
MRCQRPSKFNILYVTFLCNEGDWAMKQLFLLPGEDPLIPNGDIIITMLIPYKWSSDTTIMGQGGRSGNSSRIPSFGTHIFAKFACFSKY